MNDFDYDVLQKKRVARSAKYTNRTKPGCQLPSDNLTAAQIKKKHGEVSQVNLNEPITWAQFKALPVTMQGEYIDHQIQRWGLERGAIARMFYVTGPTLTLHLRKRGVQCKAGAPGGAHGFEYKKRIKEFEKWYAGKPEAQTCETVIDENTLPPVEDKQKPETKYQIQVNFIGTMRDVEDVLRRKSITELHVFYDRISVPASGGDGNG